MVEHSNKSFSFYYVRTKEKLAWIYSPLSIWYLGTLNQSKLEKTDFLF